MYRVAQAISVTSPYGHGLTRKSSSPTGPALTFSQMLFITAQQLPSFVIWDTTSRSWLPRLKPRQVPISQWLVLVTTFVSGTLLNNLVFAFNVPLTVQIIFRSAGACASLSLLFLFLVRAELTRLSGWSAGCRSSRVHGPRPRLHGEAIHAPTNCTALPLPFSAVRPLLLTAASLLFTRPPLPSSRLGSSSQPSRGLVPTRLPNRRRRRRRHPPRTRRDTPLASRCCSRRSCAPACTARYKSAHIARTARTGARASSTWYVTSHQ